MAIETVTGEATSPVMNHPPSKRFHPFGTAVKSHFDASLVAVLRRQAALFGEKVAFRFIAGSGGEESSLTYAGLMSRSLAVAAELQSRVGRGERALLVFPSGLEFVEAFFGCLFAGVIAVPIAQPGRKRPIEAVRSICSASKPRLVLGAGEREELGATSSADLAEQLGLPWLATDRVPTGRVGDWVDPNIRESDTAFLQFTSGSTSAPKGVVLSHRNVLANAALIQKAFGTTPESSAVFWLPLHHDMGLIGGVIQPLYCGGSSTLMAPASFLQRPALWLETVSRVRATISGGPDFAYGLCVAKVSESERQGLDLSSWEVAFTGAERIRAKTLDGFTTAFAGCGFRGESFFPCYGLAEATLMVSGGPKGRGPIVVHADSASLARHQLREASPDDSAACPLVACGAALSEQRFLVVDPQRRQPCDDGDIGEIWVQGASVAAGYYDNPEATAAVFDGRLATTDEGPFLRTGDLGFVRDGQLFVTGRLKDLIIIRGRNYYPEDIELAVEKAHPTLRAGHCAAFSLDGDQEERLAVVQEIDPRARGLDTDAVVRSIRQSIASNFEVEVHTIVLAKAGQVPMTTSGKVRRAACRELLQQGQIESLGRHDVESRGEISEETVPRRTAKAPPSAKEIERWLVQRIAGCLRVAPVEIDTDKPFLEMGMGSLDAIEVTADLQQWLGRNLSPTAIYNYPNIASLALFLAKPVEGDAADGFGPSSAGGITPAIATDGGDFDPEKTLLEVQGLSEAELAEFLQAQMADLAERPSGK